MLVFVIFVCHQSPIYSYILQHEATLLSGIELVWGDRKGGLFNLGLFPNFHHFITQEVNLVPMLKNVILQT